MISSDTQVWSITEFEDEKSLIFKFEIASFVHFVRKLFTHISEFSTIVLETAWNFDVFFWCFENKWCISNLSDAFISPERHLRSKIADGNVRTMNSIFCVVLNVVLCEKQTLSIQFHGKSSFALDQPHSLRKTTFHLS